MIRILQLLFHGCWHKWETKEKVRLREADGSVGSRVLAKCEKCGRWTKFDLI